MNFEGVTRSGKKIARVLGISPQEAGSILRDRINLWLPTFHLPNETDGISSCVFVTRIYSRNFRVIFDFKPSESLVAFTDVHELTSEPPADALKIRYVDFDRRMVAYYTKVKAAVDWNAVNEQLSHVLPMRATPAAQTYRVGLLDQDGEPFVLLVQDQPNQRYRRVYRHYAHSPKFVVMPGIQAKIRDKHRLTMSQIRQALTNWSGKAITQGHGRLGDHRYWALSRTDDDLVIRLVFARGNPGQTQTYVLITAYDVEAIDADPDEDYVALLDKHRGLEQWLPEYEELATPVFLEYYPDIPR